MHEVGVLLSRVLDGWASPAGETAPRRAKQDIPGPAAATSGKAGGSFRGSLPSTAIYCPTGSSRLTRVDILQTERWHLLRGLLLECPAGRQGAGQHLTGLFPGRPCLEGGKSTILP